jgi:hypothetical protein
MEKWSVNKLREIVTGVELSMSVKRASVNFRYVTFISMRISLYTY